jgi:hypothetical protein
MRRLLFLIALLLPFPAPAALDVKDITLGANERDVRLRFPSANCRALKW